MILNPLHCGVHHIHFDDITGVMPIAIVTLFMIVLAVYAVKRYKNNSDQ